MAIDGIESTWLDDTERRTLHAEFQQALGGQDAARHAASPVTR